jgi:hypothetical protein
MVTQAERDQLELLDGMVYGWRASDNRLFESLVAKGLVREREHSHQGFIFELTDEGRRALGQR